MSWDLQFTNATVPSLSYIVIGGFGVTFTMVLLFAKEQLYINEVVVGTVFGVLMGPHCANIFDPRSWGSDSQAITLEIMRIVLAFGLFAIGVELPETYIAKHAKGLLVMVVPTMAFGWVTVAAVIVGLFPGLSYVSALVIAACLTTPTDPVVCAAIIGGRYAVKHVPTNLRHILAAESAANDVVRYWMALYVLTFDFLTTVLNHAVQQHDMESGLPAGGAQEITIISSASETTTSPVQLCAATVSPKADIEDLRDDGIFVNNVIDAEESSLRWRLTGIETMEALKIRDKKRLGGRSRSLDNGSSLRMRRIRDNLHMEHADVPAHSEPNDARGGES